MWRCFEKKLPQGWVKWKNKGGLVDPTLEGRRTPTRQRVGVRWRVLENRGPVARDWKNGYWVLLLICSWHFPPNLGGRGEPRFSASSPYSIFGTLNYYIPMGGLELLFPHPGVTLISLELKHCSETANNVNEVSPWF